MSQRTCDLCHQAFTASRSDSRFCSKSCRAKSSRQRNERRCTIDGCENPHGARGLCYSHYGTWHRKKSGRRRNGSYFNIICIVCSAEHMASRPEGKFCSDTCKAAHYSATRRTKSNLPTDHPVMQLIAAAKQAAREAKQLKRERTDWRTPRECPGCACMFSPLYTPNAICCSKRCSRRVANRRRRAREANALGSWVWSDFMRIAAKFNYCCAYCGDKPTRLDADHVVPLSRGGYDSPSNLLPTCMRCNSDKCALSLDEWAESRVRRDLPPRATNWAPEDRRYWHLTQAALISPAA